MTGTARLTKVQQPHVAPPLSSWLPGNNGGTCHEASKSMEAQLIYLSIIYKYATA